MGMPAAPAPLCYADACRLIGVVEGATHEAARSAFRTAIKAARPDLPGGDAERFRQLIAAWALVQAHQATAQPAPTRRTAPPFTAPEPAPLIVVISPEQALAGARIKVERAGSPLWLIVPAGVRSGDTVTFPNASDDGADLTAPILIRPSADLRVIGDDLYMDFAVSPRLLEDGGRIEIETWAGLHQAWVAPDLRQPARLRLKGLGLPARDERPQGHLFVTLVPRLDAPTASELMRDRFCRDWTPERASRLA